MHHLTPEIADEQLSVLLDTFKRTGTPVQVSFRDMLRGPVFQDRMTHGIHSYPAKLFVNIPSFFLSTSLSRQSEVVLDPFCGSGTVLLEAVLADRNATGADSNPLARLITRSKLTPLNYRTLRSARRSFFPLLPVGARRDYPDVLNIEYWFHPHVRRDLLRLLDNIATIPNKPIRDFFYVALSACIKDVSLADPRLSVPVRLRENQYPEGHRLRERSNKRLRNLRTVDVLAVFTRRLDENIRNAERLFSSPRLGQYLGLASDARALTHLEMESVDFVITSPPYLGAQKYIRASSLSLTWLGLCAAPQLRALENQNIGREHYPKESYATTTRTNLPSADALIENIREINPLRAHIAATYLCEMRQAFREIVRVLKPGRHVVLIAGASHVCRIPFPTPLLLVQLATAEGLRLCLHLTDRLRSRALMTKRNHTAGRIDEESILLLRKGK